MRPLSKLRVAKDKYKGLARKLDTKPGHDGCEWFKQDGFVPELVESLEAAMV